MFARSFTLLFGLLVTIKNLQAQPNFSFNYYFSHVTDDSRFFTSYLDNEDASLYNFDTIEGMFQLFIFILSLHFYYTAAIDFKLHHLLT